MPTEKIVEAKVKNLKFKGWNFAPLLPLSVVIQWPFSELQISSLVKVDWISIYALGIPLTYSRICKRATHIQLLLSNLNFVCLGFCLFVKQFRT